ncbi:hypothetical protein B0T16DRAFT_204033 [Cercophora newfieldiana]|uniref:Uncharacterized protein n=1 Tax=Cercophora newfieldiana TaxID=92897 RepID=A0AA39XV99_9PEZI|nr:hypothetical protein B0T16DRAFT_204033 [Cercophora newfieldiana]
MEHFPPPVPAAKSRSVLFIEQAAAGYRLELNAARTLSATPERELTTWMPVHVSPRIFVPAIGWNESPPMPDIQRPVRGLDDAKRSFHPLMGGPLAICFVEFPVAQRTADCDRGTPRVWRGAADWTGCNIRPQEANIYRASDSLVDLSLWNSITLVLEVTPGAKGRPKRLARLFHSARANERIFGKHLTSRNRNRPARYDSKCE